ncbi:peptidoglycan D,D-transpeptidase FtsI family protein [Devriesea agamarum]|uniref:peptidoglycan D,D-transpeptidase FtsI family protein n=1 Tax=Devriesea agamarum TaxID=472569 RepID=UPI00071C482F|nr:penicillin-binding transpeptidase domain-containing protein [Devriesea agamarum]
MNKTLRRVSVVVTVMFLLLFGSSTYFQVVNQNTLNQDGRNVRALYNEYGKHRGPIVVAGQSIASSVKVDDVYGYQRTYTDGPLYAPVTGYYSVVYGFSGLERTLNDTLSGDADALFYQRISDVLSGKQGQGATVELSIDPAAQKAAWNALGDHRGAVVALDPSNGAVLAMVSKPSYDPNQLASHDVKAVREAWKKLNADPNKLLVNRAIAGDLYPPGSVFKLVVASAALKTGHYTKDSQIPGPGSMVLPGTKTTLTNHPRGDASPCGPDGNSSLLDAIRQSCNTSFAQLGLSLGDQALTNEAKSFGFGQALKIPLGVTPSSIGTGLNQSQLAMSSIGQYEDRVTPLQVAMISAAVANDGVVMKPQLVSAIRTSDLREIDALAPKELSQPLSAANAAQMRDMMVATVKDGTGTAAQIKGAEVGGKTGTAEWGAGRTPHAWFTGYAKSGDRKVAVAVVVEEGGYGGDAAAPVARDVMKAVLKK